MCIKSLFNDDGIAWAETHWLLGGYLQEEVLVAQGVVVGECSDGFLA